jgi:hypothetical protein
MRRRLVGEKLRVYTARIASKQAKLRISRRADLGCSEVGSPRLPLAPRRGIVAPALARLAAADFVDWRMSYSENRFPPRIKSGAGFFRDMR